MAAIPAAEFTAVFHYQSLMVNAVAGLRPSTRSARRFRRRPGVSPVPDTYRGGPMIHEDGPLPS
jgi:hypothetical protein